MSGANDAGVTPLTILKSNVSVWLGAPAIRMKITLIHHAPPTLVEAEQT